MKAIDQLLVFMQQHRLTSIYYATYDRARRLYDHDLVRHGVLGSSVKAVSLGA